MRIVRTQKNIHCPLYNPVTEYIITTVGKDICGLNDNDGPALLKKELICCMMATD